MSTEQERPISLRSVVILIVSCCVWLLSSMVAAGTAWVNLSGGSGIVLRVLLSSGAGFMAGILAALSVARTLHKLIR